MKLRNLYEAESNGSFVGVKLTPESNARLCGWMEQNLLRNAEGADQLHVTLVLDKTQYMDYHPISYDPQIPLDPSTYVLDLFGPDKNIMVLKFESDFLQKRHEQLRQKYNLSWDWPTYSPHITLCKDVQEIATEFEPPEFELMLDREYLEEFSSKWIENDDD